MWRKLASEYCKYPMLRLNEGLSFHWAGMITAPHNMLWSQEPNEKPLMGSHSIPGRWMPARRRTTETRDQKTKLSPANQQKHRTKKPNSLTAAPRFINRGPPAPPSVESSGQGLYVSSASRNLRAWAAQEGRCTLQIPILHVAQLHSVLQILVTKLELALDRTSEGLIGSLIEMGMLLIILLWKEWVWFQEWPGFFGCCLDQIFQLFHNHD